MLNILRRRAQSTVIQAVVIVIAIVFIFWGVGTNLNGNRNAVATVNGEEIPIQEYQRAYDRAVETYRQQLGGRIPPGFFESIDLKGQVIGSLIRAELFRQGAEEMGFAVSPAAVRRQVEKMEVFHQDGAFDLDRYREVLRQNRLTPASFEGGVRRDLTGEGVVQAIGAFALVPEQELDGWLGFYGEEIVLSVLAVESTEYEDKVQVKEDELAAWYAKHDKEYATKPAIRLKYYLFPFADSAAVQVDDKELQARYEQEKEKFRQPEERHARHILLKVAQDAPADQVAAKEKLAREILARAEKGEDFVALAKQYSEGPSRDQGGDLGFFPRGRMVPAFDAAVFSMKPGEIRGPVRSRFGLHVIKLEEVRPARVRPLSEVREQLQREIVRERGRAAAFKAASAAYEGIMRAGSLDQYGSRSGQAPKSTEYFTRNSPPDGVPRDAKFLDSAFSLGKGELSSLVELDDGYAILFVDDIRPPEIPDLETVRDRVVRDFRRDKAVALAEEAATEKLAAAREAGVLSGKGLITSPPIRRLEPRAREVAPQVVRDAFALGPKQIFPDKPVQVGNTFYLYQVRQRRRSDTALDKEQKEQLREQLLQAERNRLVNDWLSAVRSRAEIWTNATLLK